MTSHRYNRPVMPAVLGELSAGEFQRRRWQKKPLLVRAALPRFEGIPIPENRWRLPQKPPICFTAGTGTAIFALTAEP